MLSRRCVSANQGPGDREAGSGGRPVIRSPYSPPPRPCDARSERWCRPSARRGGGAVLPLAVAVSRGLRERGSKGTGVSPYRATAEPVPGGRPGRGGRGIAVPSPAAVGPGRPGRCRVPGAECRVPGAGCRVPGAGCRVPGADAACRVLRAGPAGRDPEEGASRHDGRTSRAGEVGGFAGGGGMMAATTTRPHRSRPVLAPGFLRGPECQLADPTRSRAGGSPPTTSAVPSTTSTREPRRSTGLVPWIDRSVPGFSVRPGFSVLARPTGTASTSRFGPSSRCPAVRAVTLAHRLRPCGASGPAGHAGRATRPGTERPIRQYSRRPCRRMAYL